MPDLLQSLHKHDLAHLRIIASLWGLELTASATEAAAGELAGLLLDPGLVAEIIASLSPEARRALAALLEAGGRLPWASFIRQFGELRQAGPGRRDREQAYRDPISASEVLFYRALLAISFFDTPSGLQEFAFIPDDLLPLIPRIDPPSSPPLEPAAASLPPGRPALPGERAHPLPASDRLLDDAVTLLAALRMGIEPRPLTIPVEIVSGLLRAAGILAGSDPLTAGVKAFLEMPPPAALAFLAGAWQASETFNDLRHLPGLVFEGEWHNAPLVARRFLLGLLASLPPGKWWSLPGFIHAVREKSPDFQRPVGDYDSWYIRRLSDGLYLRGFASWDEVDGALLRFLITGPLFWLGKVDLASAEEGGSITAFRVRGKQSSGLENARLTVSSGGRIVVPRLVPRVARYLVSRFCVWEDSRPDEYRYRVTPASLRKAARQGLKIGQLLSLLARNAASEIPPAFVRALKRWEAGGTEARLETQVVLRVSRPGLLEELRASRAGRFLGESLGPVAVVVKPGAQSKVLAALAELGLLAEEAAAAPGDQGSDPKS